MAILSYQKKKAMAILNLPVDIITIIFSRLPIETLSNVILVNKFCLHLISSPDFARAHLKQGKTNLSSYRFIFDASSDFRSLKQISYASLMFDSCPVNVFDLDDPENELGQKYVLFIGSCDGLVCFKKNKYVFIWNPCTGKYKKLPYLDLPRDDKGRYFDITYGFGYDESTGDYKVVALSTSRYRDRKKNKEMSHYAVNVFSLKRNSWKRILPDLITNIAGVSMGKLVCGKFHWFTFDVESRRKDIVYFDLGTEVFGIVELPSYYEGVRCEMMLDMLEGCICLLLNYEPDKRTRVDLWVMKEYGVKESWTKVVTISRVDILNDFEAGSMLPNGEILLSSFKYFAVYDPKDDSFRFPRIKRSNFYLQPFCFVQSLVSPVV